MVSSVPVALSPCERDSNRERKREKETVPASFRVNLFSLKCRVQRSKFAAIYPTTTWHLLQYVSISTIYMYIHRSNEPCDYLSAHVPCLIYDFLLLQRRQRQANPQLTQANHIMKATNFNYDHYNKTLERRAATTTTRRRATRRERATAALMGKLPWLMPEPKNSFSRVKVITIYRPQKSVAQHKSK